MSASEPVVRLIDAGWGEQIRAGVRADGSRLRIVSPFIKDSAVAGVLAGNRPAAIEVVTRFNLADFAAGVSDTSALRRILNAGGRIRGVRGLHSKLYVFGSARAIVTSANLTVAALHHNREFGCVSDQTRFVQAANRYFSDLWKVGKRDLTLKLLDEWDAVLAPIIASGARPAAMAGLLDHGAVGAALASAPLITSPTSQVPRAGFVKFFGEGHNRVPSSSDALEEVKRSGCHWACTYPAGRRPRIVRKGDSMYMGRLTSGPNDLMVFGRASALPHVPGRDDATAADLRNRPWKRKWPHYVRVHGAEFIAGPLSNGIPLSRLMDELGPDAFASTQANARAGSGNTNPRAALRQQPAVRLSPEGLGWLNDRFLEAIERVGRIPDAGLDGLDWPRVRMS